MRLKSQASVLLVGHWCCYKILLNTLGNKWLQLWALSEHHLLLTLPESKEQRWLRGTIWREGLGPALKMNLTVGSALCLFPSPAAMMIFSVNFRILGYCSFHTTVFLTSIKH